jgi:exodeoxyribonuclease-3
VRIATWNVNSVVARLPRLLEWLASARPDVLCLQETKVADAAFPSDGVAQLGYEVSTHGGGGRWNGVALLSRVGMQDTVRGFADEPTITESEARALAATCGGVRVWSVYVPNGRTLDSPHYAHKLRWLAALRAALRDELATSAGGVAVLGDFNIAPTDDDVWDPRDFAGSTHVSAPEREALAALLDLGFTDVPPRALKGRPFTFWDYRGGNFHRGLGMRIDLALLSAGLAAKVTDAHIDREARKGTLPSDHAPLVVDLDLAPGTN